MQKMIDLGKYPVKKYHARELTNQQITFCEAYIAGEMASKAAQIAGYKSPARAAQYLLSTNRIKRYIAKQQPRIQKLPVTVEYKTSKLQHIVEQAIPDDEPLTKHVDIGIKAIQELNKMQGHYSPTQVQQVTVEASIEDIRNAQKEYKKEY